MTGVASDAPSQRVLHWLAAVTVSVGIFVALAPVLPHPLLSGLLVGGLLVWSMAATAGLYVLLRSCLSIGTVVRRRFDRAVGGLGVAAMVLALTAGIQLWLVRTATGRDALIWNVDWRAALSHAQSIARFGDVEQSLEYAGHPIHYHVGPAWLAGYFDRVFGCGVESILFGLLPLLSTAAVLGGAAMILLAMGVGSRTAIASSGLATLVPAFDAAPLRLVRRPELVLDADTWSLGIGLMPNSYFGLAVGLSALALLFQVRRGWWYLPLGTAGLAATVLLKPQYFAGLGLLIGITGLVWLAKGRIPAPIRPLPSWSTPFSRWIEYSLVAIPAVLVAMPFVTSRTSPVVGLAVTISAYALILAATLNYGVRPARVASASHFLAAAIALAVAVPLFMTMPGHPAIYGGPALAPARTGWTDSAHASTAMLLMVVSAGLGALSTRSRLPVMQNNCNELAWLAALSAAITAVSLQVVSFPVQPRLVVHGLLMGADYWGPTSGQGPLAEALEPLLLIVAACAIGSMATSLANASIRAKACFIACALVALLLFAAFLVRPSLLPDTGYEAAEDVGLRAVLERIPIEGSILISSDIADPAQDYHRPANAPLLAAYAGHMMYLSELRWLNWVRRDAPGRWRELRIFFGSHWSPWHDAWLARNGITHLLVSDRCVPTWWGRSDLGVVPVGRNGHWTAFRVHDSRPNVDALPPDNWSDMVPRFGQAECLLLTRRLHAVSADATGGGAPADGDLDVESP